MKTNLPEDVLSLAKEEIDKRQLILSGDFFLMGVDWAYDYLSKQQFINEDPVDLSVFSTQYSSDPYLTEKMKK